MLNVGVIFQNFVTPAYEVKRAYKYSNVEDLVKHWIAQIPSLTGS